MDLTWCLRTRWSQSWGNTGLPSGALGATGVLLSLCFLVFAKCVGRFQGHVLGSPLLVAARFGLKHFQAQVRPHPWNLSWRNVEAFQGAWVGNYNVWTWIEFGTVKLNHEHIFYREGLTWIVTQSSPVVGIQSVRESDSCVGRLSFVQGGCSSARRSAAMGRVRWRWEGDHGKKLLISGGSPGSFFVFHSEDVRGTGSNKSHSCHLNLW